MPRKKLKVTYFVSDQGKLSSHDYRLRISRDNVVFAFDPKSKVQINGASPDINATAMEEFWGQEIVCPYLVTFKLSRRGKFAVGQKFYNKHLVVRMSDSQESIFTLCIFPKSWAIGDRFQRVVKKLATPAK